VSKNNIRERILIFLAARMRILVSGLLVAGSCGGNGLRTMKHDAGATGGSGGVIAAGGSGPDAGIGGSGGATSAGGMIGSGGAPGGTSSSGGASSTQGSTGGHTLGTNQCRGNGDCDIRQGATCVQPGGTGPCGVCRTVTSPCTSDSECQADAASLICDVPVGCFCPPGAKTCLPGCMDASGCKAGEVCTAHRCVPASCQSDADCPTDFGCTGGSCGRRTCTTDADCSGYCVNGRCYSAPGTCYGAVAFGQPVIGRPWAEG
jgi:hypothetical protein